MRIKKSAAFALLCMLCVFLTACYTREPAATIPINEKPAETITLNMFFPVGSDLGVADSFRDLTLACNELRQNVKITVDSVSAADGFDRFLEERLNAGNAADVFVVNAESVKDIARKGPFYDLSGLSSFQSLTASVREQALANGADGVISPLFFKSVLSGGLSRLLSRKADRFLPAPQDKPLECCRTLLAEDDQLNQEIALELLSSSGALVDIVENSRKCVERFTASPPGYYQMILTDIRMPVMNGYEAAGIPILAVTADAFSENIQAAKDAGMNGHISKPLDMAQVIAEMKRRL